MDTITEPRLSFDDTSIAFSGKSNKELTKTYWIFAAMNNNTVVSIGTSLLKWALNWHLPVKPLIKYTVFEHFCGGESIEDSRKAVKELQKYHIGTILDYSVEGAQTEAGFDATTQEILRTIEEAKGKKELPFCVFKVTGIASTPLLEKVQLKKELSEAEKVAFGKVEQRVDAICKAAFEANVRILIDGEESWIQDPIDTLAYEMMKRYNKQGAIVFNTYQMYRHEMLANLKKGFQAAAMNEVWLGAKLVRGAYMEKERERAAEMGYADPIQPNKEATDRDYNEALKFCLDNKQRIALVSGSHNEYSNYLLATLMEKHSLQPNNPNIWFAQLYGMSDNISYNLANAGYNVAKYVPYGPVASVMPYLIRRAEENTSIAGQSSREFLLVKKEKQRRRQAS